MWGRQIFIGVALLAATATVASAQAVVDLSQAGPAGTAIQWTGATANGRLGAATYRADMSGDVFRDDLIVGAPGAGSSGQGQAYIIFMGPTYSSGAFSTAAASGVTITGEAAGYQFGAAVAAGMILRLESAQPPPPRDLIVAAPNAAGGRGAVYVFAGPFTNGQTLNASNAAFKIVGAANDHLGSAVLGLDIDGDGYREIVMSAPNTGRIYVIYGGPSLSGTRDLSTQSADITITMPAMPVTFAGGDFNNDHLNDLAIGVPAATSGAGAVFVIRGRARGNFASTMPIGAADAILTGIEGGDAAGTSVQNIDFDGDGVADLLITAPGAAGPSNSRANAGEAYVFWGGKNFTTGGSLAGANVTIYGAAAGNRLGTSAAKGAIRRDLEDDAILLAPGASAAGDFDIVYGRPKSQTPAVIDLAAGIDRVLHGDSSHGPLQTAVGMPVTGKGVDIVAASPASAVGSTAAAGMLFVVYSPTLVPSPAQPTVTLAQGQSTTITVTLSNVGTLNIPWGAHRNTSWLSGVSPASGTSSANSPGQMTLTINTGSLAVGTYHGGLNFAALGRDLTWPDSLPVTLTVTPGTPTQTGPQNPFGVPDPPDEGSPDGVTTPTGTNVQVLPVRDVLVTFPSVTASGMTTVNAIASTRSTTFGRKWNAWEFRVTTTAKFSGPISVAIAYDSALATGSGKLRMFDDAGLALTQRIDTTKNIIYAQVNSLPATLTVERTPNTDFNDDGTFDLIWLNDSSRQSTVWFMGGTDGNVMQGWDWLMTVKGWRVAGSADFNADGHPDLVWQNDTTGQATVMYMGGATGTTMLAWDWIAQNGLPTGWKIAAIADLNGDGHPDLVWQNQDTRQVTAWYLGGTGGNVMQSWTWIEPNGIPGWKVVASADFNHDAHPDLVWQNDSTGEATVWYMGGSQGTTRLSWAFIATGNFSGWSIVGARDLDKDGNLDLIWQNGIGQTTVWYGASGTSVSFRGWEWVSDRNLSGWRIVAR